MQVRKVAIAGVWLLLYTMIPLDWTQVLAEEPLPQDLIGAVAFDQKLDAQVPLDVTFTDSNGAEVTLQSAFSERPVILVLGYYECPMLCSLVRNELIEKLRELDFSVGEQFDVLVVSIDPNETAEMASTKRQSSILAYGRTFKETGWHFWVGDAANVKRLADAVGFRFAYDSRIDQYAHPSGVVVLTPAGRISSYLFGIDYSVRDLRLSLVESSARRIGAVADQLLLLCYHYDPIVGKYSLTIMNIVRVAGALTVLMITFVLIYLFRQERQPPLLVE